MPWLLLIVMILVIAAAWWVLFRWALRNRNHDNELSHDDKLI